MAPLKTLLLCLDNPIFYVAKIPRGATSLRYTPWKEDFLEDIYNIPDEVNGQAKPWHVLNSKASRKERPYCSSSNSAQQTKTTSTKWGHNQHLVPEWSTQNNRNLSRADIRLSLLAGTALKTSIHRFDRGSSGVILRFQILRTPAAPLRPPPPSAALKSRSPQAAGKNIPGSWSQ